MNITGELIYSWAKDLFPICRSITGQGVRDTLNYFKKLEPELKIHQIKSGTKVFDWTIPNEWNIRDAYILDEKGKKIVDFQKNNLHVVNYSEPVNKILSLDELQNHLYSLPDQPNAIPYVTSYYEKRWGFCITQNLRNKLKSGLYHVVIDSDINPGYLNYADLIIPGKLKKEIFFSTYICHPSMANNELSGPVVALALIKLLQNNINNLKYTYRFIFIPETIGSITYLSKNIKLLKKYVIAGFNLTCLGDERCYSFLPSRLKNTLSDKVAIHVLKNDIKNFKTYSWLDRGSDERQYCSPGIDLPVVNVMRSKYGTYPEYHTSLDDLNLITPKGLYGSFVLHKNIINILEKNEKIGCTVLGEPQLGKRGLRPQLGEKNNIIKVKTIMNLLTYADGQNTILDIAEIINEPFEKIISLVDELIKHNLIKIID